MGTEASKGNLSDSFDKRLETAVDQAASGVLSQGQNKTAALGYLHCSVTPHPLKACAPGDPALGTHAVFASLHQNAPGESDASGINWSSKSVALLDDLEALLGEDLAPQPPSNESPVVNGRDQTAFKAATLVESQAVFHPPEKGSEIPESLRAGDSLVAHQTNNHVVTAPQINGHEPLGDKINGQAKNEGASQKPPKDEGKVEERGDAATSKAVEEDDTSVEAIKARLLNLSENDEIIYKNTDNEKETIRKKYKDIRQVDDTKVFVLAVVKEGSKDVYVPQGIKQEDLARLKKELPNCRIIHVNADLWLQFRTALSQMIKENQKKQEKSEHVKIPDDTQNIVKMARQSITRADVSSSKSKEQLSLLSVYQLLRELNRSITNIIAIENSIIQEKRSKKKEEDIKDRNTRQIEKEVSQSDIKQEALSQAERTQELVTAEIRKRIQNKEAGIPPEFNIDFENAVAGLKEQIRKSISSN